jgi:transposase
MTSVAVLRGPERRRRWSASQKAQIVRESFEPGAVVAAVAHRHDVHPNLLGYWRRQAQKAASREVKFLAVRVAGQSKSSPAGGGRIEIELGNGVLVRVDAGVDEVALGRVLRALGR